MITPLPADLASEPTSSPAPDPASSAPDGILSDEGPAVVLAITLGAVALSVAIVGAVLSSTALAIIAGIVALVLAALCAWLLVARRKLAASLADLQQQLARHSQTGAAAPPRHQASPANPAEASRQSPLSPLPQSSASALQSSHSSSSVPSSASGTSASLARPIGAQPSPSGPSSMPVMPPAAVSTESVISSSTAEIGSPRAVDSHNNPATNPAINIAENGARSADPSAADNPIVADSTHRNTGDGGRDSAGLARIGAAVTGGADSNSGESSELIDSLTGLLGESYFTHALNGRVAAARRHLRPLALILMDVIEGAPSKNPTHADPKVVADIAQSTLRDADTLCRLADGRFAMILEDTPENGAIWTVERIRRRINERLNDTTAWAGVACYPAHGFDGPEVLAQARRAITAARDWQQDRTEVAES